MKGHPNKDIREAIEFAVANGWKVKESKKGHAWGRMYCPKNNPECRNYKYCITSILSTPKNPSNHAKQLVKAVQGCIYYEKK